MTRVQLRLLVCLIASAILVVGLAPGTSAAVPDGRVWYGPTVYAGENAGPVGIPVTSGLGTIASLAVPTGTWVAWAKFDTNVDSDATDIHCELIAGTGSDARWQRGYTRVGIVANSHPGAANLSFNLAHTFSRRGGGTFRLACAADDPGVTAHLIRIMAMRVGTLDAVSLSTGAEATVGSGKPRVVHGYRSAAITIPQSDTFSPIASLPLPAGDWWIRADLSVVHARSDAGVPQPFACRLTSGLEADSVSGELEPSRDATMLDFNIASTVSVRHGGGDNATISCKAGSGPGSIGSVIEARQIRITAVRAGTLTKLSLSGPAQSTSGSGMPIVIHGRRVLAPDLTPTFQALGHLDLDAGKWIVSAKVSTDSGHIVHCLFDNGDDADAAFEEWPSYGRTMAMQIADGDGSGGTVTLYCRDPDPHADVPTQVKYVKITALRVAKLVIGGL